eukprot:gnl/TRDRNA2_/TRDRNA2_94417_c1_seq1.p1 gnl/TRDRNA2_/TRDRNA2_94417_c1~~gnl/TRDRNA2_/TRDRNA2_94417_c1_seq1.p1  ORF type:complete len:134 (-),score=25.80 gnl/TRDRNA2_/TRDRNA2_94417_c1_seq1:44-445(-)
MLFATDGSVSMYDFQYIGKAPAAKDLAYVLICTSRDLSETEQRAYVEHYLAQLKPLLIAQGDAAPSLDELWTSYTLSVCDLARWMVGWNRQYWNSFRRMMQPRCEPTLRAIDGGVLLESEEAYKDAIFAAFPP